MSEIEEITNELIKFRNQLPLSKQKGLKLIQHHIIKPFCYHF